MTRPRSPRRAALIAAAVSFAALAAAGFFLWRCGAIKRVESVEELRALIDRAGPLAGVAFFLLQMLTVIVAPIPSNVTMAAGALALGFTRALALGVLAILCGSMLLFLAARRLGRRAVQRLIDRGMLEKYLPLIEEKQDMFLFLAMLFPFFPDDAMCILAGLSSIPTGRFALLMALTRPWGLVFAALLGDGLISLPPWGWALLSAALAAAFFFCMRYSRAIEGALLRLFSRISPQRRKRR